MVCQCHDESPWDQAIGHLCAVENLADELRNDHRRLTPCEKDKVHRLMKEAGDVFRTAEARANYTATDAAAEKADLAHSDGLMR